MNELKNKKTKKLKSLLIINVKLFWCRSKHAIRAALPK